MRVRLSLGTYQLALRPGESLIGRTRNCQLRIDDPTVSRRHARLLLVRDVCTVSDLGSRNGVKVNGDRITDARALVDKDVVAVGAFIFTVHIDQGDTQDEVEEITQLPGEGYQVPVYRTCVQCRGMLPQGESNCPHCGAEQNQQTLLMELWSDPRGRRNGFRHPVRLRALYVSAWMTIEGEVSDISTSGAFFSAQLVDQSGTACDLLLFPTDDSEVVRFSAEVVRVVQGDGQESGVGLRFLKMTSGARTWLHKLAAGLGEPLDP